MIGQIEVSGSVMTETVNVMETGLRSVVEVNFAYIFGYNFFNIDQVGYFLWSCY